MSFFEVLERLVLLGETVEVSVKDGDLVGYINVNTRASKECGCVYFKEADGKFPLYGRYGVKLDNLESDLRCDRSTSPLEYCSFS